MMQKTIRWWLAWALMAYGIFLIKGILLPFVVGLFVAYAFNPLVVWCTSKGLNRSIVSGVMVLSLLVSFVGLLFLAIPFLHEEITVLAVRLPLYGQRLMNAIEPMKQQFHGIIPDADWERLHALVTSHMGDVFSFGIRMIAGILSNSLALATLLSLIIITPIVSFYLLRDWPFFLHAIHRHLPKKWAGEIHQVSCNIDHILGQYAKGQSLVCFLLAAYYSAALSFVGLDFSVTVGVITGFLAFVPYAGALVGFLVATSLAFAQFSAWAPIIQVGIVFLIGQGIEGYILTPNFVGDRIQLHPVWVIFSLLAGGALFGFLGILIAVPAAAAVGVLVRHVLGRYRGAASS